MQTTDIDLVPLVTLVIPARNRHKMTGRLLDSLARAGAAYRVVVVDDGSSPPLEEALDLHALPRLEIRRVPRSRGPAAARNLGLASAGTPYVAFTDNDVEVTPGWLEALVGHMEAAPQDVAGVGGSVVHARPSIVGEYATRLQLLDPFSFQGRTVYLVTANALFRRSALNEVGGFDESFREPGGEDPEVCFRLLHAGFRLEEEPAAVVRHSYSPSWYAFARMFYRYGKGCRKAMECMR